MLNSEQIQLDVLDELAYDPAVDSSRIAVTASDAGVVTLKGSVPTYAQARRAEKAAKRVRGVQAVVNDIDVKPAVGFVLDDTGVAESVLRALNASVSVPRSAVQVTVSRGWVTLDGVVDWDFQRKAAETAIQELAGVRGVSNIIQIKPAAKAQDIEEKVAAALRRNALLEAEQVAVETLGNAVILRGTVASWRQREAAERAAYAAPGVALVDNRIEVRAQALV